VDSRHRTRPPTCCLRSALRNPPWTTCRKAPNFIRAKFLWEIGLHIAGNPATPYYGNRDICITVGSGSGATYKPWPAHVVRLADPRPRGRARRARGRDRQSVGIADAAVRGTGLFAAPLRSASSPTSVLDRFAFIVHPRPAIKSLADVKAKRLPLRLSTREDPTHSTRDLINQVLQSSIFS